MWNIDEKLSVERRGLLIVCMTDCEGDWAEKRIANGLNGIIEA